MMVADWPLTFLQQGHICASVHLFKENVICPYPWAIYIYKIVWFLAHMSYAQDEL